MKKKKRIYLETSVISDLDADDRPDLMAESWRLWSCLNEFEVVIGSPVFDELFACYPASRAAKLNTIDALRYE
ncbi:MAG: hypothetical protein LBP75_08415 [Planctomycetota bacterium]|nr:hypothetical protein [Planctomycetota bacterium]